jgi:hypothetical protein
MWASRCRITVLVIPVQDCVITSLPLSARDRTRRRTHMISFTLCSLALARRTVLPTGDFEWSSTRMDVLSHWLLQPNLHPGVYDELLKMHEAARCSIEVQARGVMHVHELLPPSTPNDAPEAFVSSCLHLDNCAHGPSNLVDTVCSKKSAKDHKQAKYSVGDKIEAQYLMSQRGAKPTRKWYPGEVTKVHGLRATSSWEYIFLYDVQYFDGDAECDVHQNYMRVPKPCRKRKCDNIE